MPSDETVAFEHYRVLLREDGSIWELGRGAMGVTYKAIDDNLQKVVALKVINGLHVDKQNSRDRFLREARAAASLNHRNVAVVHHLGQNAQNFFYAMEFIDGETVEALVKRAGPLAWRDALGIVIQVTRALMAAHEKRLVHRDIKPPNIMLVPELGEDTALVKLIDFGLAKTLLEEDGSMVGANASGFVGTPLYASPEQCNEEAPDIRSDIYSLGVTLWYMLTGHPLFSGSMAKVFGQHLSAPPPLEKLPADVPESVRALLGGMLAKERGDRPQTPADLRRLIETCLRDPAPAAPAVISQPPAVSAEHRDTASSENISLPSAQRGAPTRRLLLGIVAVAFAAVLALIGYSVTRQTVPPPVAPTPSLAPTPSTVATIAPTATPSPSLTPTPTPTASPTPTPTASPTPTPSPTPSPTPLPTVTLAPSATSTPSPTLTPPPTVAVLPARYGGELRDGPGAKATVVPITIQLSADGTGGTISYGSRLGDTTVRFRGTREGNDLRAETGEVIAKPEKVQWKEEVFRLHFTADNLAATYECEKPKSELRGTLKREQPVQP